MSAILNLIFFLLNIITLAIIVRALLSWFYPVGKDRWTRILIDGTEWLLAPIRRLLASILPIPIDFSPIVAILLIQLFQNLLVQAAYRS